MPNFTLIELKQVRGKLQDFYLLLRDKENENENENWFQDFWNEIDENGAYLSELKTLFAYMNKIAEGVTLPETKFKDITPEKAKHPFKEYEFKSKHLRIYAVHQKNTGKIIVLCGYKNGQKGDIKKFRSLIQQYIEELTKKEKA